MLKFATIGSKGHCTCLLCPWSKIRIALNRSFIRFSHSSYMCRKLSWELYTTYIGSTQ